jgi:hypothetical protein
MVKEFLDLPPRELPTNSRYVCYHALNLAGTPEPVQMQVCDCGKNAVCMVCGYAFGCYPCDCDGIPREREPGWVPGR